MNCNKVSSCLIHRIQRYRQLNAKCLPEKGLDLEVMTSLSQDRDTNFVQVLFYSVVLLFIYSRDTVDGTCIQ